MVCIALEEVMRAPFIEAEVKKMVKAGGLVQWMERLRSIL